MQAFLTNPNALIGPTFANELKAAGLDGLPFSWGEDGQFCFDPSLPQVSREAILAVYAAHDPKKQPPNVITLTTDEVLNLLVTIGVLKQKDVDDAKTAKGATT